jgi:hypothetical protein
MTVDRIKLELAEVNPILGLWTIESQVWTTFKTDKDYFLFAVGLEGKTIKSMEDALNKAKGIFENDLHLSPELIAEWETKAQVELNKFTSAILMDEEPSVDDGEE